MFDFAQIVTNLRIAISQAEEESEVWHLICRVILSCCFLRIILATFLHLILSALLEKLDMEKFEMKEMICCDFFDVT